MNAETVMAPMYVTLNVDAPVEDAVYRWDFGDGNSAVGASVAHEYLDAGNFNVKLNAVRGGQSSTEEQTITVQPGAASWLVLNSDALKLESGETHQFDLKAYDELGNLIPDPAIDWIANPATGAITSDGLFTAGQEVGFAGNGVKAVFTRAGVTIEKVVPVEVELGAITTIKVIPERIDTRVTWGLDLDAIAMDDAGHVLDPDDVEIFWEILRPGDEIDQTGFYSPSDRISDEDASLLVVHAVYDGVEVEKIVYGTIKPGILDRVEPIADLTGLQPGTEAELNVTAYDRFDNEILLDRIEWTVYDPEVGTISGDGVFTAGTKSGSFESGAVSVRGFKDGIQTVSDVPVSILAAAAETIEFIHPADSIPTGAASPIQLRVLDIHGNEINDVDVYLEVKAGGSLDSGNVFVADMETGVFEDALIARILPGNAGNESLIEVKTDIKVRERSSDFLAIDLVGIYGSDIYLINLSTAEFVPISAKLNTSEFSKTTPAWWPDGSRLVFGLNSGEGYQLYDIDPFRDDVRQLTELDGQILMPAISPDGSKIAFVRAAGWAWQVYVAKIPQDSEGRITRLIGEEDAMRVSANVELRHLLPIWSPDGDLLMYTSVTQTGVTTTYLANMEDISSPNTLQVVGGSGQGWHPESNMILLSTQEATSESGENALVLMDVETGEWQPLEIGDIGAFVATFSPDGSEVAFVDDEEGGLWLTDVDGSGIRQALSSQFQPTVTAWRPKPLILPTPSDVELGNTPLQVPTGAVEPIRAPSEEHESLGPYKAVLVTDLGEVHIDLFNHYAPVTVENFINLIEAGYYDGHEFHTVEEDSAVFTGSIINEFGGTAGYYIPSEYHPDATHDSAGVVSMLSVGNDLGSSQFLITLAPHPEWNAFENGVMRDCWDGESVCYTVFGRVIEGLEILQQFENVNRLTEDVTPHRIIEARIVKQIENQ